MTESLELRTARWGKAMNDLAFGPLIIANEIVAVAADWAAYQKAAGGLSADAFIHEATGNKLKFFRTRAKAVDFLGESARRYIHHDVANWIVGHVSDSHLEKVKEMLHREFKKRGKHPLSLDTATKLIREMTGITAKAKGCRACVAWANRYAELEKQLRATSTSTAAE